jgi:hypothetical protein
MMLLRAFLRRIRLWAWRNAKPGDAALVQPLFVRLDPGLRR